MNAIYRIQRACSEACENATFRIYQINKRLAERDFVKRKGLTPHSLREKLEKAKNIAIYIDECGTLEPSYGIAPEILESILGGLHVPFYSFSHRVHKISPEEFFERLPSGFPKYVSGTKFGAAVDHARSKGYTTALLVTNGWGGDLGYALRFLDDIDILVLFVGTNQNVFTLASYAKNITVLDSKTTKRYEESHTKVSH